MINRLPCGCVKGRFKAAIMMFCLRHKSFLSIRLYDLLHGKVTLA